MGSQRVGHDRAHNTRVNGGANGRVGGQTMIQEKVLTLTEIICRASTTNMSGTLQGQSHLILSWEGVSSSRTQRFWSEQWPYRRDSGWELGL